MIKNRKPGIFFIEAKKTQLNLHDLGQLWACCKLCDPAEAFLLSSAGLGSLNKILNNLLRTDLLEFGDGKQIKKNAGREMGCKQKIYRLSSIDSKIING